MCSLLELSVPTGYNFSFQVPAWIVTVSRLAWRLVTSVAKEQSAISAETNEWMNEWMKWQVGEWLKETVRSTVTSRWSICLLHCGQIWLQLAHFRSTIDLPVPVTASASSRSLANVDWTLAQFREIKWIAAVAYFA